jgi:hypothetical protein
MKTSFLITGLLLLLVANLVMVYFGAEGFADAPKADEKKPEMKMEEKKPEMKKDEMKKEGFESYFLESAGGAGTGYEPIGPFDNVKLQTGNSVSTWRYTAPNESLLGPEFQPGPNSLFIFKNNQAKPECCSASYATDTGCVCTTPQQRNYINMRGGNRTMEDGV